MKEEFKDMGIKNFFKGLWFSFIGQPYLAMRYWQENKNLKNGKRKHRD